MPWHFVGRTELLESAAAALAEPGFGPIVITGRRGMGRSAVLREILRQANPGRDQIVRMLPAGNGPGATIRRFLSAVHGPGTPPPRDLATALTRELGRRAAGRRVIVAVDDAHLADHASMVALRALARRRRAVLVVTRVAPPVGGAPDPTECLRYEQGLRALWLPELDSDEIGQILADITGARPHPATKWALRAATGGSPRLLRDLVSGRLLDGVAVHDGVWRLGEPPDGGPFLSPANPGRIVEAVARTWQELALDRVEELCRLAQWCGLGDRVARIRAVLLLLRGRPADAMRVLDTAPADPELALVRALVLALGHGRPVAAAELLLAAAHEHPGLWHRALTCRAWLLAITGRPVELPSRVDRTDREAAVYQQAALATVALRSGQAADAVCHLRRAIATAERHRAELPWMTPFLTGCLIDALLLAGRINEATETASEFHAGKPGCGWDVAVAIATLAHGTRTAQHTSEGIRAA